MLLDNQATQILLSTGLIVERVRMVGGATIRSIGHIVKLSSIKDNDCDQVPAADMLAELRTDNLLLVDALKHAKDAADAAGDNASSGVIDTWTDEAEQRAWFLWNPLAPSRKANRAASRRRGSFRPGSDRPQRRTCLRRP